MGSERAPPSEVKATSLKDSSEKREDGVPLNRKEGRGGMGLSVRPGELAHLPHTFKKVEELDKDLWPSEALLLTLVTSASQWKGAITASPRGSSGTVCVDEGNKASHAFAPARHWVELQ